MDEFLRNLQTSGLLTPEQWKIVRREAAGGPADGAPGHDSAIDAATPAAPTPAELAQTLVRQGFITPWQAEMLLQGKKAFFIGKYRLLDCIGSGGMGAVFTALHRELGRIVAIKIMSAEVVKDRRAVARFRREVQSVAALDHPHIVTAYDAGSAGGLHYLVMEYIEGHDLGWLVKQNGPLPVEWSCECIRQAAQGLQYAHEKGMVHRDIKPTNLLVAKDRESNRPLVKILDLGLARGSGMRGGSGALTQIGQFLGTPDYISPEQGQDTRLADIRSDIFSLGCTFFRMLTAQLPFPGESVAEKLAARETIDAPRISTLRSEVPAELDIVVARMLARDPNSRYQTPREVAQALAPFTRRVAPLPAPSPAGTPVRRPGRLPGEDTRLEEFFKSLATAEEESLSVSGIATRLRRVSPRIWLVVASLTLILVAGIIAWERSSVATMVVDWPLNERQGSELRVNWRLVKLSAERQLAVRGRPGTWDFRIAREGYETIEKTVTLHRGARLEITPEWQPTPRTLRRLQVKELETRVATALGSERSSPTNVAVRGEVSAFLRDYPGSQEAQAVRKLAARLLWPLDLLDGTRVTDDLWQPPAGDPLEEPPLKPVSVLGDGRLKFWNTVTAIAATDDGRLLAGASLDGTVQVFEQADGRTRLVIVPPVSPTELAFSPRGATLAIAGATGSVTLWNLSSGTLAATLPDTFGPIAFSFDGSLIATRAARQEIALWDAQTGELRRTMQGHATGVLQGLVFSHAGKMLASYGTDSSVLLWDVASGQERRRFANSERPRFSPDDAYLAAGATNGDLILWDTRTGETQRTLDDGGYPLAFHPAGDMLVSKRQGRAVLWNLATGDEIRTIIEVPEFVAVSPDGKWLAGGDESFGEVRLWNLQRAASRRALSTLGPVTSLIFAPDSSTIIVGTRHQVLQTFAVDTGAERTPAATPVGTADLSPDGATMVMRRGSNVDLVEATTGETRHTLAGNAADLESLIFSPDGRIVAGFGGWGFFQTSLRLWNSAVGGELSLAGEPLGNVRMTAFSLDSKLLACAGDSRLVTVWDVTRRTVRDTLDDFPDRVTALAFHPDGRHLAVACNNQTVVLWDLKASSSKPLATRVGVIRQLVFQSDGKRLAGAADGRVLVWTLATGKAPVDLGTGEGTPTSLAFDPTGSALVAAGEDGVLWLWKEPAREGFRSDPDRVLRVGPPHGVIKRVLWSPDGRHLVTVNGNGTVYILRFSVR